MQSLGGSTVEIDLDDPKYLGKDDVSNYVANLLVAPKEPQKSSPYRGKTELVGRLAALIAERCAGLFLLARLIGHTLAEAKDVVDPSHELEMFPTEIGAAFEKYLASFDTRRTCGIDSRTAVDLLTPLAFAGGEGLPWDSLWAPLASSLSTRNYNDKDIELLLQHAAPYIVEGTEAGRSVYRLYHEALAQYLRARIPLKDANKQVFDVLMSLIPDRPNGGKDWTRAHAYTLCHLPQHAAAAGVLDNIATDLLFLLLCDPIHVLPFRHLVKTEEAVQILTAYSSIAHRLRSRSIQDGVSYFELAAQQNGLSWLTSRLRELPVRRRWSVEWADWKKMSSHWAISEYSDGNIVSAVASIASSRGHDEILTVGSGQRVDIWDARTGGLLSGFSTSHSRNLSAARFAKIDGRPVLATASDDYSVQVWDVNGRVLQHTFAAPLDNDVRIHDLALARIDATLIVAVAGHLPTFNIRVWDAANGTLVTVLKFSCFSLEGIEIVRSKGSSFLVAAGDSDVVVWKIPSGEFQYAIRMPENVRGLACTTIGMRQMIIAGSSTGFLRMWDLEDGEELEEIDCSQDGSIHLVTGRGGVVLWRSALGMGDGRGLFLANSEQSEHSVENRV